MKKIFLLCIILLLFHRIFAEPPKTKLGVIGSYVFSPFLLPQTELANNELSNPIGGVNITFHGTTGGFTGNYQKTFIGFDYAVSLVSFPWGKYGGDSIFFPTQEQVGARLGISLGYSLVRNSSFELYVEGAIGFTFLTQTFKYESGLINACISEGTYIDMRMGMKFSKFGFNIGLGADYLLLKSRIIQNENGSKSFGDFGAYTYLGIYYYL